MAEQTEKAFLKQPKVFLSSKKSAKGKRPGKGGNRYWKSIGLGFKTPREAIEGTYIDKKCPFTGTVSVRGRILAGTCHSAKMIRTIIVRRNYLHFIKKYQRYEKRHSNIPAHISPCFRVKEGDHVIIGQCRPLSKTVRFNVLKVIPAGSSGGGKKAFTGIITIMIVKDKEQVSQEMEDLDDTYNCNKKAWSLLCWGGFWCAQMENWAHKDSPLDFVSGSNRLESISEDSVATERKNDLLTNFIPTLRSGEWSDIGGRPYMEDTHICITDLAKNFGCDLVSEEAISFYGVFDGHGGKDASHFVRDHLPRVIVKDVGFPLELEKAVTRSFMETDAAFAKSCSLESSLASGTTALTALIFGRSLLVANAGDSRAVLSWRGTAIEMSKDHRPCCQKERRRIESLGGFIDDGYLNGLLGVTRALGDWHLEGMKETGERIGPLSAEPELKMITLTKEDEFLIIGSDGIWDVFTSQNAIDFTRRRLQEHNDVKLCCKEMVEEAIKRGATDNLTVVVVSFHSEPPQPSVRQRGRVRRSISAEGLQCLKSHLEG
ncbi:hypothetical protein V6N13_039088 [Hibiscus sabdariffa]